MKTPYEGFKEAIKEYSIAIAPKWEVDTYCGHQFNMDSAYTYGKVGTLFTSLERVGNSYSRYTRSKISVYEKSWQYFLIFFSAESDGQILIPHVNRSIGTRITATPNSDNDYDTEPEVILDIGK